MWTPACTASLTLRLGESTPTTLEQQRRYAEQRAAELRLPLVWPERHPGPVPAAMRAAAYASEQGRGAAFVLAAGRLAFCGGFDLDDPEILAEAAAAAGIGMDGCLQAVGDVTRDGAIEGAGRRLLAAGADQLPALRVGRCVVLGREPRRRGGGGRPDAGRGRGPRVTYGETSPARIRESISSVGPEVLVADLGKDRVLAVGLAQQQLEVAPRGRRGAGVVSMRGTLVARGCAAPSPGRRSHPPTGG